MQVQAKHKNTTKVIKNFSTHRKIEELMYEQNQWLHSPIPPLWGGEEEITTTEFGEEAIIIYEESREEEQDVEHVRVREEVMESSFGHLSLPARAWAGSKPGKQVASSHFISVIFNSKCRE